MSSNFNGENKVIMNIEPDAEGIFLERINRFLGKVKYNGKDILVHIHDPGRLEELLYKGNLVLLKKSKKAGRKTKWDILAARYEDKWILVNSKYHRQISENIIGEEDISPFRKLELIKPEVKVGDSRIDFLLLKNGKRIWVEVKGCTLKDGDYALFPDAPTKRGKRHIEELEKLIKNGDEGALLILVFHKDAKCFKPNEDRDKEFTKAYFKALNNGLKVYPVVLEYDGKSVIFRGYIPPCQKSL